MDVVPRMSTYSVLLASSLTTRKSGFSRALRPSCSSTASCGRPRASRADIMFWTLRKRVTMHSCIARLMSFSSLCNCTGHFQCYTCTTSRYTHRSHNGLEWLSVSLRGEQSMEEGCRLWCAEACWKHRLVYEWRPNQAVFCFWHRHRIYIQKLSLNFRFSCFCSIPPSQLC